MEQDIILTRLIDKYEKSKHLTEPGVSNRRVMLSIEKKGLPEYDYETASIRDSFNEAAIQLEKQGIVSLEWLDYRPVLTVISLNLDKLEAAYQIINKTYPKQKVNEVCDLIQSSLVGITTPWIVSWGIETYKKVSETLKLPAYCKHNTSFLSDLLYVFSCYDSLHGDSITMRAFSIMCFQNSKRFETDFRNQFLKIAQEFNNELSEICEHDNLEKREKLAFLGIYASPELYELAGKCSILTEKGCLNISPMYPLGIAIPSTAVDMIKGFELSGIKRIIFIENKPNYESYLQMEMTSEEMVIFHGGFMSPQKRKLVKKLASSICSEISVYFWGDIDLGGFRMFYHLQSLIPKLLPMKMTAEEVKRYANKGLNRSDNYLNKLKQSLTENKYPLFENSIREILSCRVTIEQEVFLIPNLIK